MSWRRLISITLVASALAVGAITLALPKPAAAQVSCGDFTGNLCRQTCVQECSNGSCCDWTYIYYKKPEV